MIKYIIGILIISISLFAQPTVINTDYKLTVIILKRNNIDLESKSLRGWVRLFNSKRKIKNYKYKVSEIERQNILNYLTNLLQHRRNKYTMEITR